MLSEHRICCFKSTGDDGVSPEMLLKDGQRLKWGEKGCSGKGTRTSKGTQVKYRHVQTPA